MRNVMLVMVCVWLSSVSSVAVAQCDADESIFDSFSESPLVLTDAADHAWSVHAADVDGDGDMDVLSVSHGDDTVAWFENDGSGSFNEHIITSSADNPRSVYAADVDGDGDIDVLASWKGADTIVWYENDGSESFSEHPITTTFSGASEVLASDVDDDGDMDVVCAGSTPDNNEDTLSWFENDGNQSFVEHTLPVSSDGVYTVKAADMDGDGDIDLLSGAGGEDTIAWYENNGSEVFTERIISANAEGYARNVVAADMDGDGDMDALVANYATDIVVWYENEGEAGMLPTFTEQVVSTSVDGPVSVDAVDVDGDGDMDVLSASHPDDTIAWFENDGSESFTKNIINDSVYAARDVYAADFDGDGDLDVVSASSEDNTIAWHENLGGYSETSWCAGYSEGSDSVECEDCGECLYEDIDEDGYDDVSYDAGNGDLNNDGLHNVLDALLLIEIILDAAGD